MCVCTHTHRCELGSYRSTFRNQLSLATVGIELRSAGLYSECF